MKLERIKKCLAERKKKEINECKYTPERERERERTRAQGERKYKTEKDLGGVHTERENIKN